jgi:hypothetical protein
MNVDASSKEAPEAGAAESPTCSEGESDVRCGCGSLLARLVPGAVELKCRRCKRLWRVPLHG